MQVHELAKKVGREVSEVKELLGVQSHLSKVSEDDITRVMEELGGGRKRPAKIVRLWSENRTHRILTSNGSVIIMDNFQLTVEKDSEAYKEIKECGDPEIRVVVDKPFDSVSEQTAFRQFLEERCITDRGEQVLYDGGDFLKALFYTDELVDVALLMQKETGLLGVIQLAVNTKSYTSL